MKCIEKNRAPIGITPDAHFVPTIALVHTIWKLTQNLHQTHHRIDKTWCMVDKNRTMWYLAKHSLVHSFVVHFLPGRTKNEVEVGWDPMGGGPRPHGVGSPRDPMGGNARKIPSLQELKNWKFFTKWKMKISKVEELKNWKVEKLKKLSKSE